MIIGITGKSGSGKSTLARRIMQSDNNAVYLEIDKVGHNVLARPDVIEEIKKTFGNEFADVDKVDRRKLGDIVFNSREEMNRLNLIMWDYMKEEIDSFIDNNKDKTIILDWLLLPVTHYFNKCDIKILFDIPYEIRKERVLIRDNISEGTFDLREKASIDFNKDDYSFVILDNKEIDKVINSIYAR